MYKMRVNRKRLMEILEKRGMGVNQLAEKIGVPLEEVYPKTRDERVHADIYFRLVLGLGIGTFELMEWYQD